LLKPKLFLMHNHDRSLIAASTRQLAAVGGASGHLPAVFLRSESASRRFWNSSPSTSATAAYFIAVSQFSNWCEARKLSLHEVEPGHVAALY
jgi:hypothetical protein